MGACGCRDGSVCYGGIVRCAEGGTGVQDCVFGMGGRNTGLNRGILISNDENKTTKKRMRAVIMARNTTKTLPNSV